MENLWAWRPYKTIERRDLNSTRGSKCDSSWWDSQWAESKGSGYCHHIARTGNIWIEKLYCPVD